MPRRVHVGQDGKEAFAAAGEASPRLHAGVGFAVVLIRGRQKQRRRDGRDEIHPRKPVGLHLCHGRRNGCVFFLHVRTSFPVACSLPFLRGPGRILLKTAC